MKGPTKLGHYSLLCKHKAISVLEARVMLRVAKDAIGKKILTIAQGSNPRGRG